MFQTTTLSNKCHKVVLKVFPLILAPELLGRAELVEAFPLRRWRDDLTSGLTICAVGQMT